MISLSMILPLLGLGMLHALEPGHGKLIISSYLGIGQARLSLALLYAGMVTILHTLFVACLGGVLYYGSLQLFQGLALQGLEILSGSLILCCGIILCFRYFRRSEHSAHLCCGCSSHPNKPVPQEPQVSVRELLWLSSTVAMTPCPLGITVFLAGCTTGKILTAFLALVLFNTGWAIVLLFVSLITVFGSETIRNRLRGIQIRPIQLARLNGLVILMVGVVILSRSLLLPKNIQEEQSEINQFKHLLSP